MMLGAGLALREVAPDLAGRIALMAVPAEEYVELEERLAFRDAGQLEFLGGKAEMVRRPGRLPFDEVMHSVRWQAAGVEHGHGTDRLSDAKSRKSAAYFFVRYPLLK